MRTLHLTNQQFEVLYHILEDTVLDIEEDVVSDTVTYQIYYIHSQVIFKEV